MNFLDSLVLPQSSEHIQLLHYILILIQFLFIPFITILFVGAVLSVYYRNKGFTEGNKDFLLLSRDIISLVTINKSIGLILGIVPLLLFVMIFTQLLHTTGSAALIYFMVSFIFISIGILCIYTYRYSVLFNDVFEDIRHLSIENSEIKEKVSLLTESSKSLSSRTGIWGSLLIFAALYSFVTGQSSVTYYLNSGDSSLFAMFNIVSIIRFLELISIGITLTGAAVLFIYFYWDGGKTFSSKTYENIIKKIGIYFSFAGGLAIPVFLTIDILALPGNIVSGSIIAYSVAGIVLLFIAYHFIYAMIKNSDFRFSGQLFFILLFAIFAFIIKDQLAMTNSTKPHSVILAAKYDEYIKKLKGEDKVAAVSGEQIYKNICSSCHSFDHKIVGPPYKETMPKYEGKLNQLVAFIRNPVKVNPNYPPMPNPGLKPNEAQAVAEWILKTYKTK